MSKKKQTFGQFSVRWPIIFWSGAIILLVIFPLILLEIGSERLLEQKRNNLKQQVFNQIDNKLGYLVKYKDPEHYYHSLLSLMFERANKSKDPIRYIKKAIPHLKKRNPGYFKFIIWDKKGKTVSKLTDEKGYKYLKKIIYRALKKLTIEVRKNYPGSVDKVSIIKKKINLFRSFLGRFMVIDELNFPLLKGRLGKCLLTSSESSKSRFWYHFSNKVGILCFISAKAMNPEIPLKKIINTLNKNSSDGIKTGIAKVIDGAVVFTKGDEFIKRELLIEAGKFENISQQKKETANLLLEMKILTPNIIGFAYVNKNIKLFNVSKYKTIILATTSLLVILLFLLLYFYVYRSSGVFSIRWKLAILFLYSNGLPLMILGFIGYAYYNQRQQLLVTEAFAKSAELISKFDSEFSKTKSEIANSVNLKVKQLNQKFTSNKIPLKSLQPLKQAILKFAPANFAISDKKGNLVLSAGSQSNINSLKILKQIGRTILNMINEKRFVRPEKFGHIRATAMRNITATDNIIFADVLARLGVITQDRLAANDQLFYFNYLGDKEKRIFNNLIMTTWDLNKIQDKYVNDYIESINRNSNNIKCIVMMNSTGEIYPAKTYLTTSINNLLGKSLSYRLTKTDNIEYKGKLYTGYGTVGKNLSQAAIIALYPKDKIIQAGNEVKMRLLFFTLMSFCLTIAIGKALSTLLMKPVRELEMGVEAIGKQNFRFRLQSDAKDEFGQLTGIFNHTLESLEDLEVARIVQENLFPEKPIKKKGLEVYGKSVSMTRLGGDYYDYFEIDDETMGVLMGDVAGHGVPAALIMAMAKATVLITDEEQKKNPATLLSILHTTIKSTKSKKIKRMMTCQYFAINSNSGKYMLANAGQCFPALVKNHGKKVEYIKAIGSPLGILKRVSYSNLDLKLEDGDTLVLYTDGMLETKNLKGEEIGLNNLTNMILSSYSENLEEFYSNLFNKYLSWADNTEDDITMVLIRFSGESNEN